MDWCIMDVLSYLLGKESSGGGGGGSSLDWSAIGYEDMPQSITEDYNYAKSIYDNWDATQTSLYNTFKDDVKLRIIPKIDTSNVTIFFRTFMNCYALEYIPILDFGKVTSMTDIISNVQYLSDAAIDNILQICIGMTSWQQAKKLSSTWGFNSTNYPATRIQALPHYQDFIDAGWTIGY